MPTVNIDGKDIEFEGSHKLLQFALDNGIEIPYFCYHPSMSVPTNCRMCLVEVGYHARDRATGEYQFDEDGNPVIQWGRKPNTACNTPVGDKMFVKTHRTSPEIKKAQAGVLEYMLVNHPLDCPICDQAGECPLQVWTYKYGPEGSRFEVQKGHKNKRVELGPRVMLDEERCINCTRCTRFTSEISGSHQLSIVGRGDKNCPATPPGETFDDPYSMPDIAMSTEAIIGPPGEKCFVIGRRVSGTPIQLRSYIIDPAQFQPFPHISIQHIIRGMRNAGIATSLVFGFISPDTHWTDSKLNMRCHDSQAVRKLFDKAIYIISPPVIYVGKALSISAKGRSIRQRNPIFGIGIEIVVEMKAIYIIVIHQLHDRSYQVFPDSWQTRIQVKSIAILKNPIGLLFADVIIGYTAKAYMRNGPEWIKPGMKFHVAVMGRSYHKSEGIIIRIRRLSLCTCQIFGPGSKLTFVESIATGPDLHNHGVHAISLLTIQQVFIFPFLLICRETFSGWPVYIMESCYPNRSEFAFDSSKWTFRHRRTEQKAK